MSASECPLCMERFDSDDERFFPCQCRYQICRFCWSKIVNELNSECPQCRKKYDLSIAHFTEPSHNEGRKHHPKQSKKRKEISNVKHLPKEMLDNLQDYRVVQKNLIYVSGLPQEEDKSKENAKLLEHFSIFGKVIKIEVNNKSTYQDLNGNSTVCAYITFERVEDAMKAVVCEHIKYENRPVRMTFGTTKYCSQFLKGSKCLKPECMYLHAVGDVEASFTKADMDQGKHRLYMEKVITRFKEEHPEIVNEMAAYIPPRPTKRRSPIHPESSLTANGEESPFHPVPSNSHAPAADNNIGTPTQIADASTSSNATRPNRPSRPSVRSNEQQPTVWPSNKPIGNFNSKVTSTQQSAFAAEDLTPLPQPIHTLPSQPTIFQTPTTLNRSQDGGILSSRAAVEMDFNKHHRYDGAFDALLSSKQQTAPPPPQMPQPFLPHQSPITQAPFNSFSTVAPPPGFENSPVLQPQGYPTDLLANAMKNRTNTDIRSGFTAPLVMDLALQVLANSSEEQLREHLRQVARAERIAELNRITEESIRQRMEQHNGLNEISAVLQYAMNIDHTTGAEANLSQSSSVQQPGPSSSRATTLNRGGYQQ